MLIQSVIPFRFILIITCCIISAHALKARIQRKLCFFSCRLYTLRYSMFVFIYSFNQISHLRIMIDISVCFLLVILVDQTLNLLCSCLFHPLSNFLYFTFYFFFNTLNLLIDHFAIVFCYLCLDLSYLLLYIRGLTQLFLYIIQ